MKWLRKTWSKLRGERVYFLLVLLAAVLASRSLIFEKGYFNMHDDLQMMRQLVMEECFLDGQIPCRWTPHMGYGFGFPLFNYYPPLPYLIGEIMRVIGFSFVNTVKLTFALSIIASGITMYLLTREFFGKLGGVFSSVFYVWAPYHAVDVYVRGAMNEAWALAFFPLILWSAYRLIKEKKKNFWVVALALSWFALFTSHNLMVLIFTPVFSFWVLMFLWSKKAWSSLSSLFLAGSLALGLSAFFTLPVILEKDLVHVETLVSGYYEYIAHFVSLNQLLISRFWGYGPSVWGVADDRMSFQIGHLHWMLSLSVFLILLLTLLRKKGNIISFLRKNDAFLFSLYLFLVGWFSLFLAHSRSTPLWQLFPPLSFVQFPWRFLTISTISFSAIAGFLVFKVKDGRLKAAAFFLPILLIFMNWGYFAPEGGKMGPLTDEEKFKGAAWDLQQTAGIYDYLPRAAKEAPKKARGELAEFLEGEGEISQGRTGTDWLDFRVDVKSEKALVRLGVFEFPDFRVFVDGERKAAFVPEEEVWGRLYFEIEKGEHEVYARLFNTKGRTLANLISLTTWLGLVSRPLWKKRK